MVIKRKNRTVWGVVGVLLTLFGVIFTIPLTMNREYAAFLILTTASVVSGVILIAWAFNN